MRATLIFPCLMMAMSIGAAFVYVADGDFRKAFYWLCATGITAAVTF